MTDITVYLTIRHNLLSPHHFGGLPNRTTVDLLLYLTHQVKEVWHKQKVVTIIFLDIANASPNAVTEWLLKNMARLGYPSEIVSFFKAMLKDRKTTLSFDDFTSLPFALTIALDKEKQPQCKISYILLLINICTAYISLL